ncbi:hypothetical protein [Moorena sp. SIO3A2]|nr:hypothetical protein [Moorena sp. SIO3A2]
MALYGSFPSITPESRSRYVLPKSEQLFTEWLETEQSKSAFAVIA